MMRNRNRMTQNSEWCEMVNRKRKTGREETRKLVKNRSNIVQNKIVSCNFSWMFFFFVFKSLSRARALSRNTLTVETNALGRSRKSVTVFAVFICFTLRRSTVDSNEAKDEENSVEHIEIHKAVNVVTVAATAIIDNDDNNHWKRKEENREKNWSTRHKSIEWPSRVKSLALRIRTNRRLNRASEWDWTEKIWKTKDNRIQNERKTEIFVDKTWYFSECVQFNHTSIVCDVHRFVCTHTRLPNQSKQRQKKNWKKNDEMKRKQREKQKNCGIAQNENINWKPNGSRTDDRLIDNVSMQLQNERSEKWEKKIERK